MNGRLTQREQIQQQETFGLPRDDYSVMSDGEIAKLLNMSRGRVHRMRKRAERKIRKALSDDPIVTEILIEAGIL